MGRTVEQNGLCSGKYSCRLGRGKQVLTIHGSPFCCLSALRYLTSHMSAVTWRLDFEVHPLYVGSITKNFCVLHIQSNTTIFHLVVD